MHVNEACESSRFFLLILVKFKFSQDERKKKQKNDLRNKFAYEWASSFVFGGEKKNKRSKNGG